jgi:hypothetical protein
MTDHRKGLAAAMHEGANSAAGRYKNMNPEAARIAVKVNAATFKPRPKEFRGYEVRAVALFLSDRASLDLSNKELATRLSADMPGYSAPANLLTDRLKPAVKVRIRQMLDDRAIRLSRDHLTTLSKIKRALRAHFNGEAGSISFTGQVTFTETAVIVGEKSYPIQKGKHRRIHVGEAKLNVDGLQALLGIPRDYFPLGKNSNPDTDSQECSTGQSVPRNLPACAESGGKLPVVESVPAGEETASNGDHAAGRISFISELVATYTWLRQTPAAWAELQWSGLHHDNMRELMNSVRHASKLPPHPGAKLPPSHDSRPRSTKSRIRKKCREAVSTWEQAGRPGAEDAFDAEYQRYYERENAAEIAIRTRKAVADRRLFK